jgi:outer membrane protein assembly factor BamB
MSCTCKDPYNSQGPTPPTKVDRDSLLPVREILMRPDSSGKRPGTLYLTPYRRLVVSDYFDWGDVSTIYSFDLATGQKQWQFNGWKKSANDVGFASYDIEGDYMAICDETVHVINHTNGELVSWYQPPANYVTENLGVSIFQGFVYTAISNLFTKTTASAIRYPKDDPTQVETLFTVPTTEKPLLYTPTSFSYKDSLFAYYQCLSFSDNRTDLYCYNITGKKMQWKLDNYSPSFRHYKPVITPEGQIICQASGGGAFKATILCMDISTGKIVWESLVPGQTANSSIPFISSRLFVDDDRLAYFIDGELVILNRHSGTVLNRVKGLSIDLTEGTVFEHRLIAYQNSGQVKCFDLRTGKVLFTLGLKGENKSNFFPGQVVIDEKERMFYVQTIIKGKILGYKIPWEK